MTTRGKMLRAQSPDIVSARAIQSKGQTQGSDKGTQPRIFTEYPERGAIYTQYPTADAKAKMQDEKDHAKEKKGGVQRRQG